MRKRHQVAEMTCSHCIASVSVSEELSSIVEANRVDLRLSLGGVSALIVTASAPIPADYVCATVLGAGYTLVMA